MSKKEMMPFIPASDTMPAHLANSQGLGNENVSTDDMSVPRINILQALSPQLDEDRQEYVKGAKVGLFHNSVTNDLYESIYVVNLYYEKDFAVFNKRSTGVKQFHGKFSTRAEAEESLREKGVDFNTVDIVETGNHYCLLLDEQGNPEAPVLISLSSTKLRISDNWNTDIRLLGGDRFGSVWELTTKKASNSKGTWATLGVKHMGWASKDLHESAKESYEAVVITLKGGHQEAAA